MTRSQCKQSPYETVMMSPSPRSILEFGSVYTSNPTLASAHTNVVLTFDRSNVVLFSKAFAIKSNQINSFIAEISITVCCCGCWDSLQAVSCPTVEGSLCSGSKYFERQRKQRNGGGLGRFLKLVSCQDEWLRFVIEDSRRHVTLSEDNLDLTSSKINGLVRGTCMNGESPDGETPTAFSPCLALLS